SDREFHRRARASERAHRYHRILQWAGLDLCLAADLLYGRGHGRGVAVRQVPLVSRTQPRRSMNPLSIPALSDFLPLFLAGMAVNFEIAAIAIALGLLLGVLLAATRVYGGFPGAGAAIGVTEGLAVILHQAEYLPSLADKLVLFAVGIAFFGMPLQVGFALLTLIQRRLGRIATRNQEALVEASRVT